MRISEKYQGKRPIVSFEVFPPKKDAELKSIDAVLEILSKLSPDYISVTFGAGGAANTYRTIELARKIKEDYHIEPLIHLTCLQYNKQEIMAIIAQLKKHDLSNILALRGDKNADAIAKNDFKHASDLIDFLNKAGDFCIAGACYPEKHPESKSKVDDIHHLKTKVDKGAKLLISQLFFDNQHYYDFIESCQIANINTPISAGIIPVINKKQIERVVSLCGTQLPTRFQKIVNKYEHNNEALLDAGMAYAVSQIIDLVANDVDGIHLYTMNNPKVAKRIISELQNILSC